MLKSNRIFATLSESCLILLTYGILLITLLLINANNLRRFHFFMPPPDINQIYNTNMHNNSRRWLANYLSGRKAHVNFNGIPSKIRPFRDGVPQGSILSPTLFNLFLHDIPTPTSQDTKILSYADDITITPTNAKHNPAATNAKHYLNTLQTWLTR